MISKDEVKKIAKLARLAITEKDEEKFQKDLSGILDYFNMLNELDVSKVEPTFHATEENFFLREDVSGECDEKLAEKLVQAAPEKKDRYIKVRAVF